MQRIALSELAALPPPAPWRDGDNIDPTVAGFSTLIKTPDLLVWGLAC